MNTTPSLLGRLSRHMRSSCTVLPLLVSAASSLGVVLGMQAWALTAPAISVTPLTTVVKTPRSGYFGDPYPIALLPRGAPAPFQLFSGTTDTILVCPEQIDANCVEPGAVTLDPGPLAAQAEAVGATLTKSINHNIVVDTLLVSSFSKYAKAYDDGKYVLDDHWLYLVYSRNLSKDPVHDGMVAQPMTSSTTLDTTGPVTLLEPDPGAGFSSELFFVDNKTGEFKLVEIGNITRIDGQYAMAYPNRPGPTTWQTKS